MGGVCPPTARPSLMTKFTASRFIVGNVPGCARQIGQTLTFGLSKSSLRHRQNIFVLVFSSACISRPIVGLYMDIILRRNHKKEKDPCGSGLGYALAAMGTMPACLESGKRHILWTPICSGPTFLVSAKHGMQLNPVGSPHFGQSGSNSTASPKVVSASKWILHCRQS